MEFTHIPVLLNETIEGLAIRENGIYVDCTAGGGGHSGEILKHLTTGKLISIDQDPDAIQTLTEKFKKNENSIIVMGNFGNMKDLLELRGVGRIDGALFDIGVSSHQLDTASRGFSFHEEAPLDMRMSQNGISAEEAPGLFAGALPTDDPQGFDVRVTVPGHTQRGGSPCSYDRVFATRLGSEAGQLILKGEYGFMVGYKNREIVKVPLEQVAGKLKMVDPDSSIVKEAKKIGISFGD